MLKAEQFGEGDRVRWNGTGGPMTGYVVIEDGDKRVYMRGGKCFRLEDLLGSPSLEVTGKVRIK